MSRLRLATRWYPDAVFVKGRNYGEILLWRSGGDGGSDDAGSQIGGGGRSQAGWRHLPLRGSPQSPPVSESPVSPAFLARHALAVGDAGAGYPPDDLFREHRHRRNRSRCSFSGPEAAFA